MEGNSEGERQKDRKENKCDKRRGAPNSLSIWLNSYCYSVSGQIDWIIIAKTNDRIDK